MRQTNWNLILKRLDKNGPNPIPSNDVYPDTGETGETYDLEQTPIHEKRETQQ